QIGNLIGIAPWNLVLMPPPQANNTEEADEEEYKGLADPHHEN
ncbi:14912_t:CDS:1, partial [Dentiscutata erythropus]